MIGVAVVVVENALQSLQSISVVTTQHQHANANATIMDDTNTTNYNNTFQKAETALRLPLLNAL